MFALGRFLVCTVDERALLKTRRSASKFDNDEISFLIVTLVLCSLINKSHFEVWRCMDYCVSFKLMFWWVMSQHNKSEYK